MPNALIGQELTPAQRFIREAIKELEKEKGVEGAFPYTSKLLAVYESLLSPSAPVTGMGLVKVA